MSMRLTHTLTLVALLCGVLFEEYFAARANSLGVLNANPLKAMKQQKLSTRGQGTGDEARRSTDTAEPPRVKNITFSNQDASRAYPRLGELFLSHTSAEFFVDGTTIPEVNFDIGPSWAGLLPISAAANESRKVWFLSESLSGYFLLIHS